MKKIILSIIMAVSGSAIALAETDPAVLYMIGGATEFGWDWNKASEMQPVEGQEGTYSYTGILKGDASNLDNCQFKIYAEKDNQWQGKPNYHPTFNHCTISKEGIENDEVLFDTNSGDYKWSVTDAGVYTITININTLKISATYEGEIEEPKALYLIGDLNEWSINNPTPCEAGVDNIYVYTGEFEAGCKFQATRYPGDWGAKFVVPKNAQTLEQPEGSATASCNIPETGLVDNECEYSNDHSKVWIVEKTGTYTLKFDLNNWTLNVSPTSPTGGVDLVADANVPAEYYNLQGVRVYNPSSGLYLVRKGGKVSKVMIK